MKILLVDCNYGVERVGNHTCIWLYNRKLEMISYTSVTPYSWLASPTSRANWLWNHISVLRRDLELRLMEEVLADLDKW